MCPDGTDRQTDLVTLTFPEMLNEAKHLRPRSRPNLNRPNRPMNY